MGRKAGAARAQAARQTAALATRAAALDIAARRAAERRGQLIASRGAALRAHDPERTLERGYALAIDSGGEPLTSPDAARRAESFDLRMAGGTVPARVAESERQEDG
jgi:exodeoxyribonuclease VII large subunit